jgi:hypothetical protein
VPFFISTLEAFILTMSCSFTARSELIVARPMLASRKFSERAYAASFGALFRCRVLASRTTDVWL